ncbi:E3 ubiquitin-protein ligase TRIM56 [Aplysia californica]|uniref:E3 ubiquitin-protein ligase TRIM56 n=1 Tax=Aplysia californica TaxID=6500 RepID=A0ABM0JB30_APLCA|nr:E3 ubiquitin-protein ligase TRIM56 [Aplysia californica]XP_035825054.1 E3 ubiquitin-protein ligase TRIM56 [Aplysia californica]
MDSEKIERLRERLLQCAVCMDEYKDPRILPCHHTLCFECIESVVQSSSASGRFFRCPQCRSDVCVPRGGVGDMPINFYIISLQDELGAKGYAGNCDICERDWLVSQFRCIDCDLDICRFCIHAHRLETHTEPPKILRIEAKANTFQFASNRVCREHADEILQMFCCTCHEAICVTCSCGDHKRHNVVPITVKLQESKTYLQAELDRLTTEKRSAVKVAELIQKTKEEVVEVSNRSMLALDAAAHRACAAIMNRKSELNKQILHSEKGQVNSIADAMNDFKLYTQRLDRGLAFLSDLQDNDICLEVVDTYKDFSNKMESMRKTFASNHVRLQHNIFTASDHTNTIKLPGGLSDHFIFYGKLGHMSWKSFCLSIDPRSLTVTKRLRGVSRLSESVIVKRFAQCIFAFIVCQFILFIWDTTGAYDLINSQFCALLLVLSNMLNW